MKRPLQIILAIVIAIIVLPPAISFLVPVQSYALPEEGRLVPVREGVSLNVIEAGSGTPVVLVHGLPGSAYDWRETLPALSAAGFRAIAYDRAGYGKSSVRTSGNDTLADNVADLDDLLTALDLDSVWLVGWSYGGATVMQKAILGDDRVQGILLVGTGGPDSADAEPAEAGLFMKAFYSDAALTWRSWVPSISRGLMSVLSAQAFSNKPQPDWWMQGLIANFSRWETLTTYRNEMFAPIATTGFTPETISMPVYILHGSDDQLAPVSIGRYLSVIIPGAVYTEIDGGSHMLPVTMPGKIAEQLTAMTASAR